MVVIVGVFSWPRFQGRSSDQLYRTGRRAAAQHYVCAHFLGDGVAPKISFSNSSVENGVPSKRLFSWIILIHSELRNEGSSRGWIFVSSFDKLIRFSFNEVWANTRKQYVPLESPSFRSAKLSNTASMFWKFWWFTILLQDPDEEEGEADPVDPDAVEAHALSSFKPGELASKG